MAENKTMKPYMKLAYGLIGVGMGVFALERLGLGQLSGLERLRLGQLSGLHPLFAGWLITLLIVVPVGLVLAGCAVFMFGRMRRL